MLKNNSKFWSLKRIFYFPKLTTKKICSIGLLIAITFVLSMITGSLRIGNFSKLSISFISVFVTAYAFGGIAGGLVGALADVISCFVNPVGPFMVQITLMEFVFGFIYGLFFYKTDKKLYILMVIICDAVQYATNIFLKTLVLSLSYGTPYKVFLISRLPMCTIQFIIILVVLILVKPFLKNIRY